VLLNYHIGRFVLGSLCVGDLVRMGLSGVLQPATRTPLKPILQPATRTPLQPSRTKSPTHNEPRTKRPMW